MHPVRRLLAELAVTGALVGLATLDTPATWRALARACQHTAHVVGRLGILAENRAGVLASNAP